ncbi:hypothetical protein LJC46_04790 [Desulfovibrio sp. OttesenSCG-928-G15]|nr:hypothetical protein [Desulfovibrio sp. OttesenSCG-928-G15]
MENTQPFPWVLFPLPEIRHRAYSFQAVVDSGFEPSEYRSLIHDESPMTAEAVLDFKVWGKAPSLTCFFRNIRTGEKFRLSAFDNDRNRCYTPRDKGIDFSERGIENGLYLVTTVKGKKGRCAWQSAKLLLAADRESEILERVAAVFTGPDK